jgi:predicted nuclease of predicted toxin-antitoxin system
MRILADENFPRPIVEFLRVQGHDVRWVRTDFPGLKDHAVLELAEADRRVLLTLDKDFWQIGLQRRFPLEHSGVVLFRVFPATPRDLMPLVVLALRSDLEWIGHVSSVTIEGVEMIAARRRA